MRVLYSPIGTVFVCKGQTYYNTDLYTQIERYRLLGDLMVLVDVEYVDSPRGVLKEDDGVELIYIKKINTLKGFLIDLHKNGKIINAAVAKCDACICHVYTMHAAQVIHYARTMGKPYLNVVVGCTWDAMWNYDLRGKILALPTYLQLRIIQSHATHTIYVTKQFLQRRYPTRGRQIGASDVDVLPADAAVLERRIQHIENMPEDCKKFTIATLAAITPLKGQKYVVKAIAEARKYGYHYEYHVIGDGNQNELRLLAQKNGVTEQVIFHGRVSHDKVFSLLDEIDLYIQPSKQEGLPRAMVEAMSRGCVAMGSNIAGIPELVSQEWLFKKGNVNQICKILIGVTKEKLKSTSVICFEKALDYQTAILQERYRSFLLGFKSFCENSQH